MNPDFHNVTCPHCGTTYPRTRRYWFNNLASADGLSTICIECEAAHSEFTAKRPTWRTVQQRRAYLVHKGYSICSRCLDEKPLDMFPIDKTKKCGIDSYCKRCRRVLMADRRAARK